MTTASRLRRGETLTVQSDSAMDQPVLETDLVGTGKRRTVQVQSDMESAEGVGDSTDVQELRQKLTMAREELQAVRADFKKQLQ